MELGRERERWLGSLLEFCGLGLVFGFYRK